VITKGDMRKMKTQKEIEDEIEVMTEIKQYQKNVIVRNNINSYISALYWVLQNFEDEG
jgi:hypothetical protein